jgi:transposase-like protein
LEEFRERPLGEFPYVYLDATFPKAREGGHARSMALAVATGVDPGGARHILGMELGAAETGELWKRLLRGLRGVRLAVSDAHSGLKCAAASGLPGCAWQPGKAHFLRSVLAEAPKAQRGLAAAMARTVFTVGSKEEAKAQLRLVALQLEKKFPKAMDTVAEAEEEALAYMDFPKGHWTQLCTANVQGRLNRGIKRRMEAVPIFPDRDSCVRLAGHALIDQHDEWMAAGRRYVSLAGMAKLKVRESGAFLPAPF